VWDKNTGEPVYNAIVWQDMRTSDIVKELEGDEGPDRFRQICGLGLSPYFSGSKIKWILDNVEGARERAERGDLLFGNTDCWVLWNLTGGINGGVHCTDVTNASRTMLMDIRTLQWREDVCEIFGIPMSMLPEIKSSSEIYGYGRKNGLLIDTPISGILGDQQAAHLVREGRNRSDVSNQQERVRGRLHPHDLGARTANHALGLGQVGQVRSLGGDALGGLDDAQELVGAPVHVGRVHDVVAGARQQADHRVLGAHARREREAVRRPLQGRERDGDQAVAVGVGLDGRELERAGGCGPQGAQVVPDGGQVDDRA